MLITSPKKTQSSPISLQKVRQLFARPARIAGSQFLRREVSLRMHERLPLMNIRPQQIADMGCGEGDDLRTLQQDFPAAEVVGVDAALAMLQAASKQTAAPHGLKKWLSRLMPSDSVLSSQVCADFARLPFKSSSYDLVWSNLALHWHPMPDVVFKEWARVLRTEGLLMFTCFGPDTCKELRQAFELSGYTQQILPFVDMHDLGDMLGQQGFAAPVMDMEQLTLTYSTPEDVLRDVRALGGNPLETAAHGLMGRDAYRQICDVLNQHRRREDGRIGLTIEVVYGHAFKAASQKTVDGETIIQWNLPRADKK